MRGAGGSLGVAIQYTTYAFPIPDNVRTLALWLIPVNMGVPGVHSCTLMSCHLEEDMLVYAQSLLWH